MRKSCMDVFWRGRGGARACSRAGWRSTGAAAEVAAPQAEVVAGAWQHHKVTFDYTGFTSLYSCDGLEDHVRQILLHLGARKDVKVSPRDARPGGRTQPHAWVDADFYSLAAADAAGLRYGQGPLDAARCDATAPWLHGRRRLRTRAGDEGPDHQELQPARYSIQHRLLSARIVARWIRVKGQALASRDRRRTR